MLKLTSFQILCYNIKDVHAVITSQSAHEMSARKWQWRCNHLLFDPCAQKCMEAIVNTRAANLCVVFTRFIGALAHNEKAHTLNVFIQYLSS